jgi:glutamate formiminotransferase
MILECVPNFSEGRDPSVINGICEVIAAVPGVSVLDRTSDTDHHRSVITFAGPPDAVETTAFEAAAVAVRLIDLSKHAGVHPRIGAIDVLPFVPINGITIEEAALLSIRVARKLWDKERLPAFLYEAANHGKGLELVRREAANGMPPDIGQGRHPTAGAVAVGARKFLIAWNVQLATRDLAVARRIARAIRFSSGGFPGVKALGLPLESQRLVQVSINSTDFEATPLHLVFERIVEEARLANTEVIGSELIGLIPARAIALSAGHDLRWLRFESRLILENALQLSKC